MISLDRAKAIILCYGGYPQAWPEQERQAVLQLLLDSKSLTDVQQEALALDRFMCFSNVQQEGLSDLELDQQCAAKIMVRLPEQTREAEQEPMTFIKNWHQQGLKISAPIALVASAVLMVIGLSAIIQPKSVKDKAEQLSLSEYMALYVDETVTFEQTFIADDDQLEIFAFLEPQIMDDYI